MHAWSIEVFETNILVIHKALRKYCLMEVWSHMVVNLPVGLLLAILTMF